MTTAAFYIDATVPNIFHPDFLLTMDTQDDCRHGKRECSSKIITTTSRRYLGQRYNANTKQCDTNTKYFIPYTVHFRSACAISQKMHYSDSLLITSYGSYMFRRAYVIIRELSLCGLLSYIYNAYSLYYMSKSLYIQRLHLIKL
jgi:hypothetical protein